MASNIEHIDVHALSIGQRIMLLDELWESLAPQVLASPLTPDQSVEIHNRLALIESGEMKCNPRDEVRTRLAHRP